MRRILSCALLGIMTATCLLHAQSSDSTVASLAGMSQRGQIQQVIDTANSLLSDARLTPADQVLALIYLGYAHQQRGEFTQATANYEKALSVVDRDGQHPSEYAAALATLATVYSQIGQIDTAKRVLLRAEHLLEEQNDHAGAAMIWNDLATIAAGQHSRGEAHKDMAHSIAESKLANNISAGELATFATTEGRIAELDGDPRTALSDYDRALDLWKQTNQDQQQRTAWIYVLMGGAYLQAGDLANARESAARGLSMLEATSGRQTPRYLLAELTYSKILDASGAHDEANKLRQEAQAGMNTGTDRQRAQGQISVNALR